MEVSPKRVRLFVLLCISPLILLFLIPQTGWIIRRQIPIQWYLPLPTADWLRSAGIPNLFPPGPQKAREVLQYEAARHPRDFRRHLTAALDSRGGCKDRFSAVATQLLPLFPREPAVYGELLRYSAGDQVRLYRSEENTYLGLTDKLNGDTPDPALLRRFEQWASAGEKLDPDNAFFPYMQALALFDMQRDPEALSAICRAGAAHRWDDYVSFETQSINSARDAYLDHEMALERASREAAVLLPQYAAVRSVARQVCALAIQLEKSGKKADALRLRHALIRCGGLMRSAPTCLVTNLVGIVVSSVGCSLPEGKTHQYSPQWSNRQNNEARLHQYQDYCARIGHPEEGAYAADELQKGWAIQDALRGSGEGDWSEESDTFPIRDMAVLAGLWILGVALLGNALYVVGLFLLGQILRRRNQHTVILVTAWSLAMAWLTWMCLVRFQSVADFRGWVWFWWDYVIKSSPLPNLSSIPVAVIVIFLSAIVPLVVLLARLIRFQYSRVWQQPYRRGSLLILAAVLIGLYSATVIGTAFTESRMFTRVDSMTHDEGRVAMQRAGVAWPGPPG